VPHIMPLRVVAVILTLLLLSGACAARGIELTPEDQAWVDAHPRVTVAAFAGGWPPFESLEDGKLVGLAPDYLRAALGRLGISVEPRVYPSWGAAFQAACRGEVDILVDVAFTAGRTSCLIFTPSYVDVAPAIVARTGYREPPGLAAVRTARIAVE